MELWRLEQEICKKYGLRGCSMNRCCNAVLIEKLLQENRRYSRMKEWAKATEGLWIGIGIAVVLLALNQCSISNDRKVFCGQLSKTAQEFAVCMGDEK